MAKKITATLIILIFSLYNSWSSDQILGNNIVSPETNGLIPVTNQIILDSAKLSFDNGNSVMNLLENKGLFLINSNIGTSGDLYFRGFGSSDIMFYLDGIPMNEPLNRNIDLNNYSVSVKDKIIFSPHPSVLIGANAFGGALNLVSPRAERNYTDLDFNLNNRVNISANTIGSIFSKNFYYNIKASYTKKKDNSLQIYSNPYENISNEERSSIFSKFGYSFTDSSEIAAIATIGIRDINSTQNEYLNNLNYKNSMVAMLYKHKLNDKLSIKGNVYSQNSEEIDNYNISRITPYPYSYNVSSLKIANNSYGMSIIAAAQYDELPPMNLMVNIKRDILHRKEDTLNTILYDQQLYNIGLEQLFPVSDKLSALMGTNLEVLEPISSISYQLPKGDYNINYQIFLNYYYNKEFKLFANLSKKSRFPTMIELFSIFNPLNTNYYARNDSLISEKGYFSEIGFDWNINQYLPSFSFFNVNYTIYYHQMRDLIQIITLQNKAEFSNSRKNFIIGTDLNLSAKYDDLFFDINLQYLYPGTKEVLENAAPEMLFKPEYIFRTNLKYYFKTGTELIFEATAVGKQYYSTSARGTASEFSLFNFTVHQNLSPFSFSLKDTFLYLRVNNLANRKYESLNFHLYPVREFIIGLRTNFTI
ncbi:MAG: TonB-dependent receptor plug domain-containing protein [Candidatus Kapabacteria bacterium]|nr:TonB-dependent receptor plug domain-containing protein [Candidatus Kapabacteria bacterium]